MLLSLGSLNCLQDPLQPVAPSWDAPFTFPLLHRSHALLEIVERDTQMLHVGDGGLISYAGSFAAPRVILGDLASLSPPDTTVRIKLGSFAVSAPGLSVPLMIPWLPAGAVVPVPDTTMSFPDALQQFPTFDEVTFAEGTMTLTVRNDLPVPVDLPSPLSVRDEQDVEVAQFVFVPPSIPPQSERSATADLAGRTLTDRIRVTGIVVHTSGSQTPVTIPQGDLLTITIGTSGLRASRAVFAEIPAQRLVDNDSALVGLDDSTLVREVRFRSGRLHLEFNNRIDLSMRFRFRLDELSRPGSAVPYEDSLALPARGTGSYDLDLAGCRIRSLNGDLVRSLQVVSSVILPSGSGGAVTVSDTDKVEVRMTTSSPFLIDTAVAVLKPTWLGVNASVAVDFGELPTRFSGQVDLPAAQLGLASAVTFGFPMDLYVSIGARTAPGGNWVYLQVPASQKRIQPGASSIRFLPDEVGRFLSSFTGRLPDSLHIIGDVLVNPPEVYTPTLAGLGAVGRHSAFQGALALEIPLMFGLSNGAWRDTISIGDTTGDGSIDYTVPPERLHGVNSGSMFIDVENALPLTVGVQITLLDRVMRPVLVVPAAGGRMTVAAASVDGNGNVTTPGRNRLVITLSREDLRRFDVAQFVASSLVLSTTPGSSAVRFRASDYVKVRAWSILSWRVNG